MKLFILLSAIFFITLSADNCGKKNKNDSRLKARFEIKAICSNYTFKLLGGDIDTSLIVASWTDESSGKTHTNVFGIDNPCSLPDTLKQGDEFYFTIDTSRRKECMTCLAYYPTPPKKLSIKVQPVE